MSGLTRPTCSAAYHFIFIILYILDLTVFQKSTEHFLRDFTEMTPDYWRDWQDVQLAMQCVILAHKYHIIFVVLYLHLQLNLSMWTN